MMPDQDNKLIRSTGGNVDELIMALIDSAGDKNAQVQEMIISSILNLGRKQPALVLSSCYFYLFKHAKMSQHHRAVLLKCMDITVREKLDEIDVSLAVEIIGQASSELTSSKEVIPEWQNAASNLLVAIGARYCNEVMEALLRKFQPGIVPHFFVVQTMANLASANVFGMVPFLNVVLGTMLAMLGLVKQDNIKWVFSYALAKFSEAVVDYVANIEKAPDPSVKKESFAAEVYSAYDVLFNVWLQSREAKVRLAIVEAVGHMAHIISKETLEEQLPKLIPTILALYKRHPEPYYITKGLCMILEAATQDSSVILEPFLDGLLAALFPQICQPIDYGNTMVIRNHNELLRCFAFLAIPFADTLVRFLFLKLDNSTDKIKIGVLIIFRHLINSSGPQMENKQALILSGLKILLEEPNNKVKKILAQTIIAMAHHGYLAIEGGQLMIQFIIRQCALPPEPPGKRPGDPEYVSNDALRSMCDNVLHLLSTTVEDMDEVMWPFLLEYLTPPEYTDAIGSIFRSVAHLAGKRREENPEHYNINFEKEVNLPNPGEIAARLLVMAGRPLAGHKRGLHALAAMQNIGPLLHGNLADLWDTVVPKLVQYLEDALGKETDFSQKNWEDLVLKLLSKTLEEVESENWMNQLGNAMSQHLPLYLNHAEEKNFLLKCLGIVMRISTKKEFVGTLIDRILSDVKHSDQLEREGCAIAMGFAAASHLDLVLTKLENITVLEQRKPSSGFLNFIKDQVLLKPELEEKTKATLMLCYGYVTLYAPPTLIISRLEPTILRTILPLFATPKDNILRQCLIQTVELIARAMHPDHLKTTHNFNSRRQLLQHMETYLKLDGSSQLSVATRAMCLNACTALVKLDPPLSEEESDDLITTGLQSVLSVQGPSSPSKIKYDNYSEHVTHEQLLAPAISSLQEVLEQLVIKNLTPDGLLKVFTHVLRWTESAEQHHREKSVDMCLQMFKVYQQNLDILVQETGHFSTLGIILGGIVPRCSDPSSYVRQSAISCVDVLLRVALFYDGRSPDREDEFLDALPMLADRSKCDDPNTLYSAVSDLSKVLSKKISCEQLMPLLNTLIESLLDSHSHSSSGVCVVLNTIIKHRGAELHGNVDIILRGLHTKLEFIKSPQTKIGALRCIRSLATYHMLTVMTSLLSYSLPLEQSSMQCWQVIVQDPQLVGRIIEHLLHIIARSLPYEEKQHRSKTIKTALVMPLAATCALSEIFVVDEAKSAVLEAFPELFVTVMIRLASMADAKPPVVTEVKQDGKHTTRKVTREVKLDPCACSITACTRLLTSAGYLDLLQALHKEEVWKLLTDPHKHTEGFFIISKHLAIYQPQIVTKVISNLAPILSCTYEPQRIMASAFFAELIQQRCCGDVALVEMLVNSLLGRLADSSRTVRMLCIQGLGNVVAAGNEQVKKFSTTVLSALMAGMDDKEDFEDDITLQAMKGLSKVLAEIDETHIRAILINISLKIRPGFEKVKGDVRASAFTLFGDLSRFGDGPSKEPFLEQIHTNLIALLVHLNDPETQVREACRQSLYSLGPLLDSEPLMLVIQKYLSTTAGMPIYGEFINDFSKILIQHYDTRVNLYVMGSVTYFKSNWSEIRANATVLTGFLLGNMRKKDYDSISREHVCKALIALLEDPESDVRIKAAEAMSRLHNF